MSGRLLLCCLLMAGIPGGAYAQLRINEFMASNGTVISDPDYGDYADWVELFNAGSAPVNLNGYYLTDNLEHPDKWQIIGDFPVSPGEYLLIWADGRDSALHAGFRLSRQSEEIGLYTPGRALVDTIRFAMQTPDISYGRDPADPDVWGYFPDPTPGSSNTTQIFPGIVDNEPEFSLLGGLFTSAVEVELFTDLGGTIRFTLDGSVPDAGSTPYTEPLQISSTTIVRARIFKSGLIPGRTVTHSYFMNENFQSRDLPVISIATDPDNFWDPEVGIYVQNFKPGWEVPVNLELFENDGSDRAAFNTQAGVKINGLNSWQLPQKMLGVYFRKQYGEGNLSYRLFNDKPRAEFGSFALRASGSDWSYTLFRDILVQNAIIDRMEVDYMASRPCVVYVNGEYMGIHNIREKVNDDYIIQNHGLAENSFDLVENQDFPEAGDMAAYNHLSELLSRDLSVQSNYEEVEELLDIENFTDMAITHIYDRNTSYYHNLMAWKPKGEGKWKWVLMDLDRGFFNPTSRLIGSFMDRSIWPLPDLMDNPGYAAYFGKRLADHLYTSFNAIRIRERIEIQKALIEEEIPDHVNRWLGTTSSYGNAMPSVNYWYQEVNDLGDFAELRPGAMLDNLVDYGFSQSSKLDLYVTPENGGTLEFNGMLLPEPEWSGGYPQNLDIDLYARDRPGFNFVGWAENDQNTLISRDAEWNYLDDGSDQGIAWREVSFDDAAWSSGNGQLGYGDGDENTLLGYGPDGNNKYITSYFRHTFQIDPEAGAATHYSLGLMRDDGAIVYLNGTEVIRSNLPSGSIDYQTLAVTAVGGGSESEYLYYPVEPDRFNAGMNVIAVEVHQSSASSSDLSFDLELKATVPSGQSILSSDRDLSFTLSGDRSISAVYETTGECLLRGEISSSTTLTRECSPWYVTGDVIVDPGVDLTIEPGVTVYMSPGTGFTVHGRLIAEGTQQDGIRFCINPDSDGESWGALCFIESADTSRMRYLTLEDASAGQMAMRDVAAVSAFKANLVLDQMVMEDNFANPVSVRYSDLVLTNSRLHSKIKGDLVNVKYGTARIENCEFTGNKSPDTDGIDYDEVLNGRIQNCRIHDFRGFNSDAVDIGEHAVGISIDSLLVYNITDKGVSVGQRSVVEVRNSIFANCGLGVAVKDSSNALIDHCTFYGVGTPAACYEKNPGKAGGNARVMNSILSNSYSAPYLADQRSNLRISSSISDNTRLPEGWNNRYGNPLFRDPSMLDFGLLAASPAIKAGSDAGNPVDMGSLFLPEAGIPQVMISNIYYDNSHDNSKSEFLTLYNPSEQDLDISGYTISQAIEYTFPAGSKIPAKTNIFVVKSVSTVPANAYWPAAYQWTSGSLANEGELIRLADSSGIILDQVRYGPAFPWPYVDGVDDVIGLMDLKVDNHFGENWINLDYKALVTGQEEFVAPGFRLFPNPTRGPVTVYLDGPSGENLEVYTLTGQLLHRENLSGRSTVPLDLGRFRGRVLLIRIGPGVLKCLVLD